MRTTDPLPATARLALSLPGAAPTPLFTARLHYPAEQRATNPPQAIRTTLTDLAPDLSFALGHFDRQRALEPGYFMNPRDDRAGC
jgi:hypothetical protein